VLSGEAGLIELCENTNNDIIVTATSGKIGLRPTLKAIECGIDIALANKETLVMAGDIVIKKAQEHDVKILPVDSEHSAIFQCCQDFSILEKIIITASGGPFLYNTKDEMADMKANDALKHPKWHMGAKITIDSSTLMNKGLEVIEAHHVFILPYNKIDVVIHPQSIVHSAVEFKDGSVLAQLGVPSMHLPIQYAITYPKRVEGLKSKSFNFAGQNLTFEKPDFEKFPCLKLAYKAGKIGGSAPVALNAANDIAVAKFLKGEIKFSDIEKTVEYALSNHTLISTPTLDEIFAVDKEITEKLS
jgi:1-deoxy-D-xylulose-5-phosphate reductoisomerase